MRVNNGHGSHPQVLLAGERYQHLTVVLDRLPGHRKVLCRCDCGTVLAVWFNVLRRQYSCGCATAARHRAARQATAESRFWARVHRSEGCWEWQGARSASGYGVVSHEGADTSAHRRAWELTNGPIPAGLWVLHRCDNRPCVRPDHLYLGTPSDNLRDTHARHPTYTATIAAVDKRCTGEASPNAKLTEQAVREIRAMRGARQRDIAQMYGVHQITIWQVLHGHTWRHVAGGEEHSGEMQREGLIRWEMAPAGGRRAFKAGKRGAAGGE